MENEKEQLELDDIEELIDWNLQYGIPLRSTLGGIYRLDLYDYFQKWFTLCYGKEC
jgi:hypothetical protein